MTVYTSGYVFQDDGDALNGATVQLLQVSDGAEEASTTTNSSGFWSFNETDEDRYDVKITSGTSIRFRKWADEISLKMVDARNNEGAGIPAAVFTNLTNSTSNQVAIFRGANTTRADNDEIYLSFELADSGGALDEFARITAVATDVTAGSEDGALVFSVADTDSSGDLQEAFRISSSTGGTVSQTFTTDSVTFGTGGDEDVVINFNANTADGVLTWMEDEDYFKFSDDILMNSTERINFYDTGIYIYSSADGQLDLVADTEIQIAATTIDIDGAVAFNGALTGITNITLSGTLSDGNYTFDTSGNVSGLGTIGSGAITSTSTVQGTTITATTAFVPDASDGAALGTTSLEFSDLYLADGAVVGFGDDQDVTLTHVVDTGLLLSSTDRLQFGDAGTFIHQSADGVLTIESDTTVDINGAVALNGAITGATDITLSGELDAATLDLSSSADIAGDLVLSGGADGALQFSNAGENSIKIPDNQASALIIEEADNAYITFVTTNSSEAITIAKATTFSAGIADSGTIAAGTWNGGTVAVGYGGTGASTLAANSVLTGNGSSAIVAEAALTFDGSTLGVARDGTTGIQVSNTNASNPALGGFITLLERGTVFGASETFGFRFLYDGNANTLIIAGANESTVNTAITIARDSGNITLGGDIDLGDNDLLNVGASGSDWDSTSLRNAGDYFGAINTGMVLGHTAQTTAGAQTAEFQMLAGDAATDTLAASSMMLGRWSTDATGPFIFMAKSRHGTIAGNTIVQDDDSLGGIIWFANDGTNMDGNSASIYAQVDGTPGVNDVPGRLIFQTTADGAVGATERMRIDSAGNVGIGTTAPSSNLEVAASDAGATLTLSSWDEDTVGSTGLLKFTKSDSDTIQTFEETADGEWLGTIGFYGSDSSNTISTRSSFIDVVQDGSAGSTRVASYMSFGTGTNSGAAAERMRIHSTGEVDFKSNALGITNVGASGNDWTRDDFTLNGHVTDTQTMTLGGTDGDKSVELYLRTAASGVGQLNVIFYQGSGNGAANNMGYILGLHNNGGYFRLRSHDINGSSGDEDIFRVYDGNADIRAHEDWVDDYYDYICDGCNKHSDEVFTCCGEVKWHDDVLALREMGKDETVMQRMVDLGVMHRDEGDDWLGISLQKAQHFTWSGIYQNRERMDAQHEAMDARLKRIEQALGV